MLFRSGSTEGQVSGKKVSVEDVKSEWRFLWRNRIDDKVRAEGIAKRDYSLLFIDQGTVIAATKKFKKLNFKAILCLHGFENDKDFGAFLPSEGGYRKFARTVLNKQKRIHTRNANERMRQGKLKKTQLRKKGGRGWLHNFSI